MTERLVPLADPLPDLDGDDRWFTPAEVATYLRISKRWAYDLIRDGRLPSAQPVPRVIRVKKSAADAWMAASSTAPPAA